MSKRVRVFQNKDTTVAVYEGCKFDAIDYIERRSRENMSLMPDRIVGKVKCHKDDEFDESVGIREAYRKADRTHNKLLKAAIKRWMISQIRDMKNVDKDIFNEVIKGEK